MGQKPLKLKVGDKARIVSPSGSNKVMIRLGSCDSTLTRTVDTGLTVTVKFIDKKQSPDCFLITDDGNVLGWIPKDKLEPVGPAQE